MWSNMFSYVYYTGGMALIGAVACGMLYMGHRNAPARLKGRAFTVLLTAACALTMVTFPYVGYSHADRYREVTRRNNEFAAIEAEIMKLDFNLQCGINGSKADRGGAETESLPCIQRENIRIVSNPHRAGLVYFLIEKDDTPVRWRGLVDYPIPFSFPNERRLLSPESVRRAFIPNVRLARIMPQDGK